MMYHLKRALSNMLATPIVTLVAILTISLALTCLILYHSFLHNLQSYIHYRIDGSSIVVYLNKGQDQELESFFQRSSARFRYIDKQEALSIFTANYPNEALLLGDMGVNPLPASYIIHLSPENIGNFRSIVSGIRSHTEQVLAVEYSFFEIQTLQEALTLTERFRYIIGAFAVFISAVMVSNTIRISYYKYLEDIQILRIIGASSMFVKSPFFLEALLIGVMSIGIATGLSFYTIFYLASDSSFLTILGDYQLFYPTIQLVLLNASVVALLSVGASMFTLRGSS